MEWRLMMVLLLLAGAGVMGCSNPTGAEQKISVTVYKDSDRDGVPDYLDACPGRSNIGNIDSDGDMLSDECDLDPTGSGSLRPVVIADTGVSGIE
jgi:hypothetical protein